MLVPVTKLVGDVLISAGIGKIVGEGIKKVVPGVVTMKGKEKIIIMAGSFAINEAIRHTCVNRFRDSVDEVVDLVEAFTQKEYKRKFDFEEKTEEAELWNEATEEANAKVKEALDFIEGKNVKFEEE